MLRDLIAWWTRQIRSLLPQPLLPDARREDVLSVAADLLRARFILHRRGRKTLIGGFTTAYEGLAAAASVQRGTARQVIVRLSSAPLLRSRLDCRWRLHGRSIG